jgi:arylesterase / paraoxonase
MSQQTRPLLARPSTWVIVGLIILTLISYTFFRAWVRAGEMTRMVWRFDGSCTTVGGIAGAEDLVLDRERRVLWVSSDDRTKEGATKPGAIHAIAFDAPALTANPVSPVGRTLDASFSPHGMSLFVGAEGNRVLGVINHPKGALDYTDTAVELFDVGDDNSLTLRAVVTVPSLVRINDIAMTGPDSFYATSESDAVQGSASEVLGFVLDSDQTGAVWHVNNGTGKKVADGIGFANSVALSPDGSKLYVSGTIDRTLHMYQRDAATNALTKVDAAQLGTGLDNLDVEPDGRIWLGSHPKLFTFFFHSMDPTARFTPSQVLIVELATGGPGGKVDQVLLQEGSAAFSGATSAIRDGNRMVLGSAFSPGLQVCTLPAVWKHSEAHPAMPLIDPARDDAIKAARKAEEEAARKASAP